ncbi:MAG: autotransporter outer membrane beta-barrel domain-containing protein, partial [Phenylobacterium sp.]
AAISAAISQAASQPAASQGQGGWGAWAAEIAFHIEHDREAAQGFRSNGFGLAAGLETQGTFNALGVSGALVTTEYKDQGSAVGERVTMNLAEGGLYWRLQWRGLQADARAGLGYVKFDSDRRLATDTLAVQASGKWNGWIGDLHAGAAYEARAGRFFARPELSVDYLRLSEDAYQESGGGAGFDLKVDDRQGDLFTGQALVALGMKFGDEAAWWAPELKLGWRARLAGDPGQTTAAFKAGGGAFTLDPEDAFSGGAVVRLGVRGGAQQVVYAVDAGGTFDKGYSDYDLRATVRLLF